MALVEADQLSLEAYSYCGAGGSVKDVSLPVTDKARHTTPQHDMNTFTISSCCINCLHMSLSSACQKKYVFPPDHLSLLRPSICVPAHTIFSIFALLLMSETPLSFCPEYIDLSGKQERCSDDSGPGRATSRRRPEHRHVLSEPFLFSAFATKWVKKGRSNFLRPSQEEDLLF